MQDAPHRTCMQVREHLKLKRRFIGASKKKKFQVYVHSILYSTLSSFSSMLFFSSFSYLSVKKIRIWNMIIRISIFYFDASVVKRKFSPNTRIYKTTPKFIIALLGQLDIWKLNNAAKQIILRIWSSFYTELMQCSFSFFKGKILSSCESSFHLKYEFTIHMKLKPRTEWQTPAAQQQFKKCHKLLIFSCFTKEYAMHCNAMST